MNNSYLEDTPDCDGTNATTISTRQCLVPMPVFTTAYALT